MAKLNTSIRNDIIRGLVLKSFKDERQALLAEEHDLAAQVWAAGFKSEHLKLIRQCPASWFETTTEIKGRFDFQHINLSAKEGLPIPHARRWATHVSLDAKDALAVLVMDWHRRQEEFNAKVNKAKRMAEATLASVSTVNRLIEVWPEVKPFIPEAAKVGLPMVPVKELNAAFKLP